MTTTTTRPKPNSSILLEEALNQPPICGREYCTARGCNGTECYMCRKLYPNRKRKYVARKA